MSIYQAPPSISGPGSATDKLYLRARKSKDPDVKIHYKRFRAHAQKVLRDAYWKYVSNIFTFENDSSDPDTPKPEKIKKFWSFVKSLKKDAYGITSLRENRILKTDSKKKANICYRQFQSAFTHEDDSDPPSKGASPFSSMGDITVDPKGVTKLLDGLNVHKASGPDGLNARALKECSNEISPILALIYNESLARDLYQMSGDKQMFLRSLKRVKNMMLLTTGRCRSHASAAKP